MLKLYKALLVSKQISVLHKVFVLFRIHLPNFLPVWLDCSWSVSKDTTV